MGGFGNVLFQLVVLEVLKENKVNVFINTSLTEKNYITQFIGWKIHEKIYEELIENQKNFKPSKFNELIILSIAIASKVLKFNSSMAAFFKEESQLNPQKIPKNIFGYFQEKKFLNKNKHHIKKVAQKIQEKFYVKTDRQIIIHFRGSDSNYLSKSGDYVSSLIKILKNINENVLIVTDDPNLANKVFNTLEYKKILKSASALEDFKILLTAKNLYCSPSTFSWWAAHALPANCNVILPSIIYQKLGFYGEQKFTII